MKDQFKDYFLMGNIFNPSDAHDESGISTEWLVYHYNVLTAENHMKPNQITREQDSYNFATADRMVNAAIASGFKVVGHTLLWHSQIPQWQIDMAGASRQTALAAMRKYIADVAGHFRGRIYSWDVLNEVFPDGLNPSADWQTSMRTTGDSQGPNPWYAAIGHDFVYEAYLAARLADPNAILYYNDYNTDQLGKATMIRDMVRDVNARYRQEYPNETRLLIEGIGMQEHHNTGVPVGNIRRALDLFRPLGVKISVSELDVLAQSWDEYRNNPGSGRVIDTGSNTITNRGIMTQANLYREYMKLYLENSDIIERVTLWGVIDEQSWRAKGLPLLFDMNDKAKPAYYYMTGALDDI
jgi:endo-1,4-beta-xylanase